MKRFLYFSWLWATPYLASQTRAQLPDQYAYTRPDSAKAYWLLKARPTDQTPTVQFYNAHHRLLYQEALPATARHVDRFTQHALDQLLTRLTNNRLLQDTYLNQPTEASAVYILAFSSAPAVELCRTVIRRGAAVLWVEPSLAIAGKLSISCGQKSNRLLFITLEDSDHREFFSKGFKTDSYKCTLSLSQLPSGQYYVKVGPQHHPIVYKLLIDQSTQQYVLQYESGSNG